MQSHLFLPKVSRLKRANSRTHTWPMRLRNLPRSPKSRSLLSLKGTTPGFLQDHRSMVPLRRKAVRNEAPADQVILMRIDPCPANLHLRPVTKLLQIYLAGQILQILAMANATPLGLPALRQIVGDHHIRGTLVTLEVPTAGRRRHMRTMRDLQEEVSVLMRHLQADAKIGATGASRMLQGDTRDHGTLIEIV